MSRASELNTAILERELSEESQSIEVDHYLRTIYLRNFNRVLKYKQLTK